MVARRLVILSASFRRVKEPGDPIPALQRFDGVYFRLVRKYLRGKLLKNTDIVIVSDKYGILTSEDKVPYDLPYPGPRPGSSGSIVLDHERLQEQKDENLTRLKLIFGQRDYSEVYANVGKEYLTLIEGFEKLTKASIAFASGQGLGPKAKHMKEWILRSSSS